MNSRADEAIGVEAQPTAVSESRRRRSERGQVLPLAAIGLLATVLAVLATVNLSEAVHRKIRLQATADAAAYTAAAMEARTFNYIAFLNRAQIAHYNTATLVQSYITWVGSHVAVVGSSSDMIMSLTNLFSSCQDIACKHPSCFTPYGPQFPCNPICFICLAGYAYMATPALVSSYMAGMMAGVYQAAATLGHYIVEAMSIFNYQVMWKAQAWRAVLMNGQLLTGFRSYIEKNEPDENIFKGKRGTLATVFNSALNSYEYYQAFDGSAGVNPQAFAFLTALPKIFSGNLKVCPTSMGGRRVRSALGQADIDRPRKACRVMTNMVNASRYPRFVYNRSLGGAAQSFLPGGFGGLGVDMSLGKFGTTRFVSEVRDPEGGVVTSLLQPGGTDEFGVSLASHDYFGGTVSVTNFFDVRQQGFAIGDAIVAWSEAGRHGPHYLYRGDALAKLFEGTGIDLGAAGDLVNVLKGMQDKIAGMTEHVEELWTDTWKEMQEQAKKAAGVGGEDVDFLLRPDGAGMKPGQMAKIEAGLEKVEAAIQTGKMAVNLVKNAPQIAANYMKKKVMEKAKQMAQEFGQKIAKDLMKRVGQSLFGSGLSVAADIMAAMQLIGGLLSDIENNFTLEQDHGRWPGFAPYFKFRACPNRARDFCQPSTWIFLSQPYDRFVKPDGQLAPSQSVFSWSNGEFVANIDTTAAWDRNAFMFDGLNVLSRGRVYYHCRGGPWGEHPNFFNPCWRAQLAPIGQKLTAYFNRYAGDAMGLTELPMANQLQNLAMGAMGDMFAALVTSLVTH
jgi:hypothetical protein